MSKGLLVTIDGLSALFARLKMRFYRPRRPLPYGRGSELHGVSARNVFVLLGGPRRAMGAPLKVSVWRGWSGLVRQGVGCREGTRLRCRLCGRSDAWPGCPRGAVRDWGRATFILLRGPRRAMGARLKMRFNRPRRPLPYGRGSVGQGVDTGCGLIVLCGRRRAIGSPLKMPLALTAPLRSRLGRAMLGFVVLGSGCYKISQDAG